MWGGERGEVGEKTKVWTGGAWSLTSTQVRGESKTEASSSCSANISRTRSKVGAGGATMRERSASRLIWGRKVGGSSSGPLCPSWGSPWSWTEEGKKSACTTAGCAWTPCVPSLCLRAGCKWREGNSNSVGRIPTRIPTRQTESDIGTTGTSHCRLA